MAKKKYEVSSKLPLLYFAVVLLFHFVLPLNWADDSVFFQKAANIGLAEFLANTARPLVDTVTYFFARFPVLWRLINPLVFLLNSLVLTELIPTKAKKRTWWIVTALILFPSFVLVDAGFIATTVNYLWPFTFGLLALLPIKKIIDGQAAKWYEFFLIVPCLIYACNMQQMSVLLIVVLTAVNTVFFCKKRPQLFALTELAISVICFIHSCSLNLSGENSRMFREINRYFPSFESLNIFQKVELGFSSTVYCLTSEFSLAWGGFLAFLIFLLVAVSIKKRRVMHIIPILCVVLFSLVTPMVNTFVSKKNPIFAEYRNFGLSKAEYHFEPLLDWIFLLIILTVLYSVFLLLEKRRNCIVATSALVLGFGTRMLMGFSPTVWASGYRTFYIFFVALIFIIAMIVENLINTKTTADDF